MISDLKKSLLPEVDSFHWNLFGGRRRSGEPISRGSWLFATDITKGEQSCLVIIDEYYIDYIIDDYIIIDDY